LVSDIGYLHHVGLVVDDMVEAVEVYRRFGFELEPATYPALPSDDGTLVPLGAAQTSSRFERNFIEIVSVIKPGTPLAPSAKLVPIQAPPDRRAQVRAVVQQTMDRFAAMLARHQGLHRLVFWTPDADAVAARLTAAGVDHTGVTTTQRPVEDGDGVRIETIRHLEVHPAEPAGTGENEAALLAVAEMESLHRTTTHHPNGALDVTEAILTVSAAAMNGVVSRYETYLGRAASGSGSIRTFELDRSRFTVVADDVLDSILPGEIPAVVPSLAAFAVQVQDASETEQFLRRNDVPLARTASGDLFIPSRSALGAAVIFRAAV
jgi:catechol 2,3-dioxygenase-like lactoylglutathione lyase family enzyme